MRFATELGYDGYPHLQRALQEMIRNKLTSVQRLSLIHILPALPTLGESEQVQLELDTSAQDAGGGQLSIGDTPDSTAEETG